MPGGGHQGDIGGEADCLLLLLQGALVSADVTAHGPVSLLEVVVEVIVRYLPRQVARTAAAPAGGVRRQESGHENKNTVKQTRIKETLNRIVNLIGYSKGSNVINVFTKITQLGRERSSTALLVLALEN